MVFQFGWVYLRRYWVRLVLGLVLGVLFGMTNASFVWATKTLMERLEDPAKRQVGSVKAPVPAKTPSELKVKSEKFLDRWLPRYGRELNWQHMLGGVLFLPLLVAIRSSTNFTSSYCIGWASERMINDMRLDVLEKLSTLSLDFFTRSTTGDLLTRINGDTASLLRCLRLGAADMVKESITLISILGMLIYINPLLTVFVMAFVPLCLFPLMVLAKKVRNAAKKARGGEILQTSQLVELVSSIRIIKAFHLESERIERYRKLSRGLVRLGMRGLRARELTTPLIEFISMLGLGVLIVFVFRTGVGLADFVSFLMGMIMFFAPVKKLASVHIMFEQTAPGVQRLVQILQMHPSVREPENPTPISKFESDIRFEQVGFGYGARPVIRKLSLVIPRGSKLGIAGASGSGKSTLINLLFRFYDPKQGSIKIDGIDLREISFRDLRQLMALVSQEVVVFDETVAENIGCGRSGATREEIEAAARAAYAHEFIMQLPKGYETRLGERGLTLSGGQRQRIAIARAFIRNAPILVLDEATGSLDSEAEAEVQRAVEHLSENRTVISVAHRLSTLGNCDRVIVLTEGRIVEEGSFNELVEKGGTFASMARRQGIFATQEGAPAKARPSRPSLPQVIASSVIRSTHQGQSHGGVYIVDLESEEWRQVIDWNDVSINWEGRGADRGLRGIALHGGEVYLAASDELFVYGPGFKIARSFRNPFLKHCHEICVFKDHLYLTSTGFDAILEFDLAKQVFTRGWCLRELDLREWNDQPRLVAFDPNSKIGPEAKDTYHINNVFVRAEGLYVAGTNLDVLWQITARNKLEPFAKIPKGTHNARPFRGGVLMNDTSGNRLVFQDRNGQMLKTFPIEEYPKEQLQMADLPADHARQGFGRGLAIGEDGMVIAGCSPATLAVYELGASRRVKRINLTMDIRNSIHGLTLWPLEYYDFAPE